MTLTPTPHPMGVSVVDLQPPSSKSTPHGPACDAGVGSSGHFPSARWHSVDLCHDSTAGTLREEGPCLPGSGAFSSLLVPAAHRTSRGTRLSEFSGILPGGYQEVLQSPSQLPGKYNTRWLGRCPSRTPEGGSWLVLSAPYGTSLLASGL